MLAINLADRPRAERIYEELAAYPHHNTPDAVMLYEGSVSHFLAQLAAFLGRRERVARHFDDALAMNERLGLRPQLAHGYCAYARWLLGARTRPSRKSRTRPTGPSDRAGRNARNELARSRRARRRVTGAESARSVQSAHRRLRSRLDARVRTIQHSAG